MPEDEVCLIHRPTVGDTMYFLLGILYGDKFTPKNHKCYGYKARIIVGCNSPHMLDIKDFSCVRPHMTTL